MAAALGPPPIWGFKILFNFTVFVTLNVPLRFALFHEATWVVVGQVELRAGGVQTLCLLQRCVRVFVHVSVLLRFLGARVVVLCVWLLWFCVCGWSVCGRIVVSPCTCAAGTLRVKNTMK